MLKALLLVIVVIIVFTLYYTNKEGFQSSDTACTTNCGAGSICIKYSNGNIDSCNKLTYTPTNTCNLIGSYQ